MTPISTPLKNAFAASAILILAVLFGCGWMGATPGAAPEVAGSENVASSNQNPLADTEWRLVEIQSMDDAVGVVRPDDPSLYTMRLNADGTAQMRLNCNSATGPWTAQPSTEPSNGRFRFGLLATTKALCPPPSLDEKILADLKYVRGYLLKDGRLYLKVYADGGIYAWEPNDAVHFSNTPNAAIETAVLRSAPDYTTAVAAIGGPGGRARYIYNVVDLNGDGNREALVYLLGSIFCGSGGCNLMLFTEAAHGYRLVNTFPITRLPIIVAPGETDGWKNLIRRESGGGAPPSYVIHTFDGKRYVQRERLPGDAAPVGKRYLVGEFTFQDGVPLEPVK